MNLAEFPICLATDRRSPEIKELVFTDQIYDESIKRHIKRTFRVSPGVSYGLPTATDDDIIVGLIQLTRLVNNFTDRKVVFTRGQLIDILGWQHDGRVHNRIAESLHRWCGVTLYWKAAWRNNEEEMWESRDFHLIESVHLFDTLTRDQMKAKKRLRMLPSEFTWSEEMFRSFQANYLKKLDLDLYFGKLSLSTSRRMYRYLDKRFYHSPVLTFDLRKFAEDKVGIQKGYPIAKIKQILGRGFAEMEAAGIVAADPPEKRYAKVRRGEWTLTIRRPRANATPAPKPGIQIQMTLISPEPEVEYLESLTPIERETVRRDALNAATEDQKSKLHGPAAIVRMYENLIVHEYVRTKILRLPA